MIKDRSNRLRMATIVATVSHNRLTKLGLVPFNLLHICNLLKLTQENKPQQKLKIKIIKSDWNKSLKWFCQIQMILLLLCITIGKILFEFSSLVMAEQIIRMNPFILMLQEINVLYHKNYHRLQKKESQFEFRDGTII